MIQKNQISLWVLVYFLVSCTSSGESTVSPQSEALMASFTVSQPNPKLNETVVFKDQSKGNPTAWLWDFGDRTTSKEQNPKKEYVKSGDYEITLKVSKGTKVAYSAKTKITVKLEQMYSWIGNWIHTDTKGTYTYAWGNTPWQTEVVKDPNLGKNLVMSITGKNLVTGYIPAFSDGSFVGEANIYDYTIDEFFIVPSIKEGSGVGGRPQMTIQKLTQDSLVLVSGDFRSYFILRYGSPAPEFKNSSITYRFKRK